MRSFDSEVKNSCFDYLFLESFQVLKLLAKRYRESNPEGKAQVISYATRPVIKITPPPSASDRRTKVYHYVEAVKALPCNFTMAEITPFMRRINPELMGQIRSLFVVLSDDQFRQVLNQLKKQKPKPAQEPEANEPNDSSPTDFQIVQPKTSKRGAKSQGGPSAKK